MRQIFTIIILASLLIQVLTVPFLAFQLETQREEVAVPMCVNRDAPELACFGSCYINQQLSEAFEQQQSGATPEATSLWQVPPFSTPAYDDWCLRVPVAQSQSLISSATYWQDQQYVHPHWHPPRG